MDVVALWVAVAAVVVSVLAVAVACGMSFKAAENERRLTIAEDRMEKLQLKNERLERKVDSLETSYEQTLSRIEDELVGRMATIGTMTKLMKRVNDRVQGQEEKPAASIPGGASYGKTLQEVERVESSDPTMTARTASMLGLMTLQSQDSERVVNSDPGVSDSHHHHHGSSSHHHDHGSSSSHHDHGSSSSSSYDSGSSSGSYDSSSSSSSYDSGSSGGSDSGSSW